MRRKLNRQLRIERKHEGEQLGFEISFDPGDDAGDSLFLPYDAMQYLQMLTGRFLSSCMCTEVIQRWEKHSDD